MIRADGLGGFASGTASGIRTRRYHSLLLADAGRLVLVNGFDAQVTALPKQVRGALIQKEETSLPLKW